MTPTSPASPTLNKNHNIRPGTKPVCTMGQTRRIGGLITSPSLNWRDSPLNKIRHQAGLVFLIGSLPSPHLGKLSKWLLSSMSSIREEESRWSACWDPDWGQRFADVSGLVRARNRADHTVNPGVQHQHNRINENDVPFTSILSTSGP